MLSSEDAKTLIYLGREVVRSSLVSKPFDIPEGARERFSQKRGVFTTLLSYPDCRLRGCIGIPEPIYPLWRAVIESSLGAAFRDPRFKPLTLSELNWTLWEVSILSDFRSVDAGTAPESLEVGKHGIMVVRGKRKGLLLPKVAREYHLTREEFLDAVCLKAGLPQGCWREHDTEIYIFETSVFREIEPGGSVVIEKEN